MATKSAGRVSIRVLPDSSRFRDDLRVSLERIEKTMKAEIPAHLVVTRESIRRLKEQLKDLEARIKVEPYVTEEQLHHLKKQIEDIDPRINANLNALNAQRRLATLSRDREVSLFVKVNKASLAAAASTLAALSGGRLVSNVVTDFFDKIKNLDKNAPKIGLIATGIAGISAAAAAGLSNIGGLIGSLAQLVGIATVLPAYLIGGGVAIGVLVAALKDMKTVLGDLAPAFHTLQDSISSEFWKQAADPIRDMVRTLLPSLSEQLINTAQALGGFTGDIAKSIKRYVTPDYLNTVFDNMNRGLNRARRGIDPFIHSLATLGKFGSSYFERTGDSLANMAERFDRFVDAADKDGRLKLWTDNAIKAFKDLGQIIKNTTGVFTALNTAAQRAGGAGFADLAVGLKKLADVMNTEGFQRGFETIFAGAHQAMDGLFDGLKRLGPGLSVFAVTIGTVFGTVGKILGQLGEDLSALFSDPTLNQGIKDFFSGFLTFVTDLKPAMAPLGQIIGTLATALGSLLSQSGPLLAEIAQLLAPLFADVWKAIQPLIPDLISLTSTLVKELGPILVTFVKEVLPPLIPIIKDLIPIIKDLVKATSPVVVAFFKDLGEALRVSGPYIKDAATWVDGLVKALDKFPKAFYQQQTGDQKGMLQTLIQIAIDHPEIPGFFKILNEALGGLFTKIGDLGKGAEGIAALTDPQKGLPRLAVTVMGVVTAIGLLFGIGEKWNSFWEGLQGPITAFGTIVPPQVGGFITVMVIAFGTLFANRPTWDGFWGGLPAPVAGAMTLVTGSQSSGIGQLITRFVGFFASQEPAWGGFWGRLVVGTAIGMAQINLATGGGFTPINSTVMSGLINIGVMFSRGWAGVASGVPNGFVGILTAVSIGIASVVARTGSMPNQMLAIIFSYITQFRNSGAALVGAFAEGISSGVNPVVAAITAVVAEVAKHLPHSPAKKGPLSGRGYPLYSGRATVDAFAQGMRQRTDALGIQTARTLGVVNMNGAGFSTASAASVASGAMSSRDRALVNIEGDYYGATPERVADEFDTKLRRANLVAQLGKVSK